MLKKTPLIVGIQEVRKMLGGVSKQYLHQLIRQNKLKVFEELACGKIFLYRDIVKFQTLQEKRKKARRQ